MKFKTVSAVLLLATVTLPNAVWSEDRQTSINELYNLCSQFPLNSRCEGVEIPSPLDERPGVEATCILHTGLPRYSAKCKVETTDLGIIIYAEQGEPIEVMDRRRDTLELILDAAHLFSSKSSAVNRYVIQPGINRQLVSTLHHFELGFLLTPETSKLNRTAFVQILTERENLATALPKSLYLAPLFSDRFFQAQVREEPSSPSSDLTARVEHLLETKECVRCDLRDVDLSAAKLEDANLEGANLQGANLQDANLETAYLVGANLDRANLSSANLRHANLMMVSLQEATLSQAKMKAANLQGSNLQGANLQDVQLIAPANLQNTNLANANLQNANLQGANFRQSNLTNANLQGADLSDTSASMYGIRSDFQRILRLGGRGIQFYTNFQDANLTNANLLDANSKNTSFQNAKLCSTTMPDGMQNNRGC